MDARDVQGRCTLAAFPFGSRESHTWLPAPRYSYAIIIIRSLLSHPSWRLDTLKKCSLCMICKERGKSIALPTGDYVRGTVRWVKALEFCVHPALWWRLCKGHADPKSSGFSLQLQRWPVVIWAGYGSPWAGSVGAGEPTRARVMVNHKEKMRGGPLKQAPHLPPQPPLPKMLSLMTLTWARKANSWL